MVLFEIHQRFKGHFFNELRVSFKAENVQMLSITKAELNLPDAYKKYPQLGYQLAVVSFLSRGYIVNLQLVLYYAFMVTWDVFLMNSKK